MAWSYSRAVEYAEGKAVSQPGTQRINALMHALGDPQNRYFRVHVVGTNGKGSVSAYIAAILTAAGYKTGRFSSPAVIDRRECIAVDGECISPLEYAYCMERVASAAGEDRPTSFEAETAAALLYFAFKGCRAVVLEAGMGGKDDATNVSGAKAAAAITSISLDHTEFLGGTLEKIALAKVGIADGGVKCYSCIQESECERVIKDYCSARGIECAFIPPLPSLGYSGGRQLAAWQGKTLSLMPGVSQPANAALALAVCKGLEEDGFFIPEGAAAAGVKSVTLQGRQELIGGELLLDGAHNPAAARELASSLEQNFPGVRKVALVGIFADKDYRGVLQATLGAMSEVFTFDWENKRALGGAKLAECASMFCKAQYIPDIKEALAAALKAAHGGMVAAFGSFSHLKLIKKAYLNLRKGAYDGR